MEKEEEARGWGVEVCGQGMEAVRGRQMEERDEDNEREIAVLDMKSGLVGLWVEVL